MPGGDRRRDGEAVRARRPQAAQGPARSSALCLRRRSRARAVSGCQCGSRMPLVSIRSEYIERCSAPARPARGRGARCRRRSRASADRLDRELVRSGKAAVSGTSAPTRRTRFGELVSRRQLRQVGGGQAVGVAETASLIAPKSRAREKSDGDRGRRRPASSAAVVADVLDVVERAAVDVEHLPRADREGAEDVGVVEHRDQQVAGQPVGGLVGVGVPGRVALAPRLDTGLDRDPLEDREVGLGQPADAARV